nr:CPBP family intramembrane metalloprotease [Gammaproteobacteria bacterium]
MSEVPRNSPSAGSKRAAAAEVTAATFFYLAVAFAGLRLFDISAAMSWLTPAEAEVVSGFLVGAMGQIAAVALLWLILRPADLDASFAATRVSSTAEGWFVALAIIVVEATVMFGFLLDVGWRALEPSAVNTTGSIAPLVDGVTQEVFFRGYLILRLARGGYSPFLQLLFSSVAFSAIHVWYVGEGWSEALPPLLGTVALGAALGWAFIRAGYSLRPPIIAHVAILVLIQPWLALAR